MKHFLHSVVQQTTAEKDYDMRAAVETDVVNADDTSRALSLDHFITVPPFFPPSGRLLTTGFGSPYPAIEHFQ